MKPTTENCIMTTTEALDILKNLKCIEGNDLSFDQFVILKDRVNHALYTLQEAVDTAKNDLSNIESDTYWN